MSNQPTAEQSARRKPRNQSLFTPFSYTFPREHFEKQREANQAEISDFHGAKTIQDKLRVMQAAQVTAQSMMHNLDGFANDFALQLQHMHEAFESFLFGFEQLQNLMNDTNKMGLKVAEYECEKMKDAE